MKVMQKNGHFRGAVHIFLGGGGGCTEFGRGGIRGFFAARGREPHPLAPVVNVFSKPIMIVRNMRCLKHQWVYSFIVSEGTLTRE